MSMIAQEQYHRQRMVKYAEKHTTRAARQGQTSGLRRHGHTALTALYCGAASDISAAAPQ